MKRIKRSIVDHAVSQLAAWQQEFWEAVQAGDRERAEQLQEAIAGYPDDLKDDLFDVPAISEAWSRARSDTDLELNFMGRVPSPPQVWEAKAQFERLGREINAVQTESNHGEQGQSKWRKVGQLQRDLSDYFGDLDPGLRQHPVLRYVMGQSRYNFTFVSRMSPPSLSPEERAELKFRRIYQWTEDQRLALYQVEISPPSQAAEDEWFESEMRIEERIKEVIEARSGRLVNLFWCLAEDRALLLLTYSVECEEHTEAITEALASSGLFSVNQTRRVRTSQELRYLKGFAFPFSDAWKEEELDQEELEAYRAYRRRAEERKRHILATTPCHVCGRFVEAGELCSIDIAIDGTLDEDEDDGVSAEEPAVRVYCSEHRKVMQS